MNYEENRNRILNKYVSLNSRHLNWIRLDGNSNKEHKKKVCDICVELSEKNLDFITRPEIVIWEQSGEGSYQIPESYYPDILVFLREPFRTVVIEVINSESKDHAESKFYPDEFKIISIGVNESIEGLL